MKYRPDFTYFLKIGYQIIIVFYLYIITVKLNNKKTKEYIIDLFKVFLI